VESSDYEFERFKEKDQSIPYIPLEEEIDALIAGFTPKYSPFLQLLKETGFRTIEARRLTPNDFDLIRKTVTLNNPAKNSLPRQFRISDKLISMLMPLLHKTDRDQRIWDSEPNTVRATYSRKRNELAEKLGISGTYVAVDWIYA
jgi:integrase